MSDGKDPILAPASVGRDMRRHLHDHWRGYAFQGALMALAGLAALLAPLMATLASTIFFGWLLVVLGVVGLVAAFRRRGASGFWSSLLLSVLVLLLGFVILNDPFAGAVTLTTVMAVYFLLTGLVTFSLANAFRASTGRFWLLVVSGAINVALALFLVIGLPGTAVWAVGVFLGVSLVMSGVSLLFAALDAREGPRSGRG